jgi:hypothetical protein
MKPFLPKYFGSEWSFAHAHLPSEGHCIVAFSTKEEETGIIGTESLIVVCLDGTWLRYTYDSNRGGEAIRDGYFSFAQADQ